MNEPGSRRFRGRPTTGARVPPCVRTTFGYAASRGPDAKGALGPREDDLGGERGLG